MIYTYKNVPYIPGQSGADFRPKYLWLTVNGLLNPISLGIDQHCFCKYFSKRVPAIFCYYYARHPTMCGMSFSVDHSKHS